MRRIVLGLSLAAVLLAQASAAAEPTVSVVPLPFTVTQFRAPSSRAAAVAPSTDALRADKMAADKPAVIVWGASGGAAIALAGRDLVVKRLGSTGADIALAERPRDAIPNSRSEAAGPITVSLAETSREYAHEALGDRNHAKVLVIAERKPVQIAGGIQPVPVERTRLAAGPGAVFEDREPRLVPAAGAERPAVLVVKSYLDRGAALALVAKRDGVWRIVSETPPIGEPGRWLNPAAVADFLGAGSPQIALVRTPHLDGMLQIWALAGDKLELKAQAAGYANHAFGEAAQDLAATMDLDGDGRPELVLPTLDRRSLAILSFKEGLRETARIQLPARVTMGVATLGTGADTHILAGLEDGRIVDVRP